MRTFALIFIQFSLGSHPFFNNWGILLIDITYQLPSFSYQKFVVDSGSHIHECPLFCYYFSSELNGNSVLPRTVHQNWNVEMNWVKSLGRDRFAINAKNWGLTTIFPIFFYFSLAHHKKHRCLSHALLSCFRSLNWTNIKHRGLASF